MKNAWRGAGAAAEPGAEVAEPSGGRRVRILGGLSKHVLPHAHLWATAPNSHAECCLQHSTSPAFSTRYRATPAIGIDFSRRFDAVKCSLISVRWPRLHSLLWGCSIDDPAPTTNQPTRVSLQASISAALFPGRKLANKGNSRRARAQRDTGGSSFGAREVRRPSNMRMKLSARAHPLFCVRLGRCSLCAIR